MPQELDKIMGVDVDSQGRQVVKVQAGVTLKTLDMWLGNRGLEVGTSRSKPLPPPPT